MSTSTTSQNVLRIGLEVKLKDLPTPEGNDAMQMLSFPMQMNCEGAAGALVKMKGFEASGSGTIILFW